MIRNPATERADRILDLLDQPGQATTEDTYGHSIEGRCWRCNKRPESDSPSGLCDPCRSVMLGDTVEVAIDLERFADGLRNAASLINAGTEALDRLTASARALAAQEVPTLTGTLRRSIERERSQLSLRAVCCDEADYTAALALVDDLVAGGTVAEIPHAIAAVTEARKLGITDPWVVVEAVARSTRTPWRLVDWLRFLDHIADWPNRDALAGAPERTSVNPWTLAAALTRIEVAGMLTVDDLTPLMDGLADTDNNEDP